MKILDKDPSILNSRKKEIALDNELPDLMTKDQAEDFISQYAGHQVEIVESNKEISKKEFEEGTKVSLQEAESFLSQYAGHDVILSEENEEKGENEEEEGEEDNNTIPEGEYIWDHRTRLYKSEGEINELGTFVANCDDRKSALAEAIADYWKINHDRDVDLADFHFHELINPNSDETKEIDPDDVLTSEEVAWILEGNDIKDFGKEEEEKSEAEEEDVEYIEETPKTSKKVKKIAKKVANCNCEGKGKNPKIVPENFMDFLITSSIGDFKENLPAILNGMNWLERDDLQQAIFAESTQNNKESLAKNGFSTKIDLALTALSQLECNEIMTDGDIAWLIEFDKKNKFLNFNYIKEKYPQLLAMIHKRVQDAYSNDVGMALTTVDFILSQCIFNPKEDIIRKVDMINKYNLWCILRDFYMQMAKYLELPLPPHQAGFILDEETFNTIYADGEFNTLDIAKKVARISGEDVKEDIKKKGKAAGKYVKEKGKAAGKVIKEKGKQVKEDVKRIKSPEAMQKQLAADFEPRISALIQDMVAENQEERKLQPFPKLTVNDILDMADYIYQDGIGSNKRPKLSGYALSAFNIWSKPMAHLMDEMRAEALKHLSMMTSGFKDPLITSWQVVDVVWRVLVPKIVANVKQNEYYFVKNIKNSEQSETLDVSEFFKDPEILASLNNLESKQDRIVLLMDFIHSLEFDLPNETTEMNKTNSNANLFPEIITEGNILYKNNGLYYPTKLVIKFDGKEFYNSEKDKSSIKDFLMKLQKIIDEITFRADQSSNAKAIAAISSRKLAFYDPSGTAQNLLRYHESDITRLIIRILDLAEPCNCDPEARKVPGAEYCPVCGKPFINFVSPQEIIKIFDLLITQKQGLTARGIQHAKDWTKKKLAGGKPMPLPSTSLSNIFLEAWKEPEKFPTIYQVIMEISIVLDTMLRDGLGWISGGVTSYNFQVKTWNIIRDVINQIVFSRADMISKTIAKWTENPTFLISYQLVLAQINGNLAKIDKAHANVAVSNLLKTYFNKYGLNYALNEEVGLEPDSQLMAKSSQYYPALNKVLDPVLADFRKAPVNANEFKNMANALFNIGNFIALLLL